MKRFRRASAILPEPLEGFGRTVAENHGRCIVHAYNGQEQLVNRAERRLAARLLGRESRKVLPTLPYCRYHGIEARAAISLGLPILLPPWALEPEEDE